MEARQLPGIDPGPSPAPIAISAWNIMQGIDWQALPIVCEMFGVSDAEKLIVELIAIRDHQGRVNGIR